MSAYDQRVRELSRLPKTQLAALYGSRHTFVYLAAPLVKWSKDELISSILADEFPHGRPQPEKAADEPVDLMANLRASLDAAKADRVLRGSGLWPVTDTKTQR